MIPLPKLQYPECSVLKEVCVCVCGGGGADREKVIRIKTKKMKDTWC